MTEQAETSGQTRIACSTDGARTSRLPPPRLRWRHRFLSLGSSVMVAGALIVAACTPGAPADTASDTDNSGQPVTSSRAEQPTPGETTASVSDPVDAVELSSLSDVEQRMLTNYGRGVAALEGVWQGYDPQKIPTVIAMFDRSGTVTSAFTIGHSNPDALGRATPIKGSSIGLSAVYRVTDLEDPGALAELAPFVFSTDIGDEQTFVIAANEDDGQLSPGDHEFTTFLIHEQFHRYQEDAFTPDGATQDIEGYDYSKENLELALLEERVHLAIENADGEPAKRSLAAQLVALRDQRLDRDPRVRLDNDQERIEGTATYIEHRIGADIGTNYDEGNYVTNLSESLEFGARSHFGFGRFYNTGASTMGLLRAVGVDDADVRVQAGQSPMAILAEEVPIAEGDRARLVAEARADHDPNDELPAMAEGLAEKAASEGPVFGDDGDVDSDGS